MSASEKMKGSTERMVPKNKQAKKQGKIPLPCLSPIPFKSLS